jgi:cell fate (sporulation/competence/biofilm development) regulator YlbF (YheA/YmcA/DUF963 family)
MLDPKLVELAEKLGTEMAASKATREFKHRSHEVAADAEAQAVLKNFQSQLDLMAKKQHEGKPIEVAEKHALRDLQEKTYNHDKLKALMAARADYVEMVQQVNDILGKHLSAGEEEDKH